VLKRARQARFCVYVDAMAVGADQRAAVLLDPNGIRVKLFESAPPAPGVASAQSPLPELGTSAAAIVEASAAASAASSRLVALEVSVREMQALEKAVTFYDSLVPARAELDDAAAPASSRRNSLFAQLRMQSFRLVDHESFLSDMVTYAWLANGPRSARTALCLVHARAKLPPTHSALLRGDAATAPSAVAASGGGGGGGGGGGSGSGGSGGGGSGAGRVVLGLGFRVHDLEKTLATLRTQAQESVGTLQMQFIAGFPRFASFADPAGLVVELTDEQMRQPNAPQPQPQQQHQPSAGRSSRAQ
jgi:catechol 2,3-dioxygenase-like lactoylglutathione lyase family enzyme